MRAMLGRNLYRHSLGVAEAAAELAERFGADPRKAYLAGLLHDYAKSYSRQDLRRKARRLGLTLDRITARHEKLLHAPVGAALLVSELKISDPDIIRAVYYHTTGRSRMTLLEKVVYLADYIAEGRDYEGVAEIRQIAEKDLDRALLASVDHAIQSVLARRLLLHPCSVAFRNSLLEELQDRKSK
jgi:predicted HD superfamily hydrolase involved in NAD metabolism